jgi:hypothetical protein
MSSFFWVITQHGLAGVKRRFGISSLPILRYGVALPEINDVLGYLVGRILKISRNVV